MRIRANDGKLRVMDCFDSEGIVEIAKAFPGNKATQFLDWFLYRRCIDWSRVDKFAYLEAMRTSVSDSAQLKSLLKAALTDRISDREMFMKGIDYSYYYEESTDNE